MLSSCVGRLEQSKTFGPWAMGVCAPTFEKKFQGGVYVFCCIKRPHRCVLCGPQALMFWVTLSVCEIVKFQNDCLFFHLTMFDVAKKTCSHQSVTSTRLVRFCDGWPFIGNLHVDVLPSPRFWWGQSAIESAQNDHATAIQSMIANKEATREFRTFFWTCSFKWLLIHVIQISMSSAICGGMYK